MEELGQLLSLRNSTPDNWLHRRQDPQKHPIKPTIAKENQFYEKNGVFDNDVITERNAIPTKRFHGIKFA